MAITIPTNNPRVYYALRRRLTGGWLSMEGYPQTPVEQQNPTMLRQKKTAVRHRLNAFLSNPDIGPIDIVKVVINVEDHGAEIENELIQTRMLSLVKAIKDHWSTRPYRTSWQQAVPEYVEFAEELMQKHGPDMRYLAVFFRLDDAKKPTMMPDAEMKKLADYKRKGEVYLIRSEKDFAILKLCEGFIPSFVYDFDAQKIQSEDMMAI